MALPRALGGRSWMALWSVWLPIGAQAQAIVAVDDAYTATQGSALNVDDGNGVLANDTGSGDLRAVVVGRPEHGPLLFDDDGGFIYIPGTGFSGSDTFTYHAVADDLGESNVATVTITVQPPGGELPPPSDENEAPVAHPDSYTTTEETPLAVAASSGVLANDTDGDGDALIAALMSNAEHGSIVLGTDGSFTFNPSTNFSGTTHFTYQARDGAASSSTVTVSIEVTNTNDPPFITNSPSRSATEGVTYRYTLTASDPDGTTPTVSATTLPAWLEFVAPATITGTPAQEDAGNHAVALQVSDGIAEPVPLRFEIAVAAVDNAPTIEKIPGQTATEGAPFELDLAQFVTDPDTPAATLRYAATSGLPEGLALSEAGQLTGTPALTTSTGSHKVAFTVADAENSVAGELTLDVLPAGRVDLAVAVAAAPNPAPLDTAVTWTITITNRAPETPASAFTVTAAFAGDVPFTFDAPATAGCTAMPAADEHRMSCALGPLAAGASTAVTLTGSGGFAGDVYAAASVEVEPGSAIDEMPGNDSATGSLSLAQRVSNTPAQRIAVPNARAATAGDFDGDGFDDLAVATASAAGLVLLTNVEDPAVAGKRGLASTPQGLGGEALGADVAAADLDKDGDLDLVLAARAGAPDRLFLNAGGTFSSTALGDGSADSRAVSIGDVNGDGFDDLVFAGPGSSRLFVNSGSGGVFAPASTIGEKDARDVLLVDLLGDPLPELVVAAGDGDAVVYRNGAGAFTRETTLATGPTSTVAAGDFNGDGRADLVFGRSSATPPELPSSLVWLNSSGGQGQFFVADELGAAGSRALLVADFDLRGRDDVFDVGAYGARLFTNAGANGTFGLHPQQLATVGAEGAAAGSFGADERLDVAIVDEEGVEVFANNGDGNFGSADSTPPELRLLGAPSIDITIDSPYTDPGATAMDDVDGDLTSRIVVTNPVDTTVLGAYTVTYAVSDLSRNAAVPVTRTVNVRAQEASGGSGALGLETLLALAIALLCLTGRRRARQPRRGP